jgi:hypothetical protein
MCRLQALPLETAGSFWQQGEGLAWCLRRHYCCGGATAPRSSWTALRRLGGVFSLTEH